jgi:hypothetical protein
VAIEKAFEIEAEPGVIWDALWSDLLSGDESAYVVESSHRPESLSLRVELGGIPCILRYSILARNGSCEVAAELEPQGFRYALYQFLTFGHVKRNFELVLVTALSNLKAAVEGGLNDTDENAAERG